jgi:membrane dipeptidase
MTRLLIDGHNDLPYALRTLAAGPVSDADLDRFQLDRGLPDARTDLPRLTAGGVSAQFWSVYVPADLPEPEAVVQTLQQIDLVRRLVGRHVDRMVLASTADEVAAAFRAGRIASLVGAEGGHSIGGSLGVLRMLRQLGVRYLTLTHTRNTAWADSATDAAVCGGLSEFGRDVVREMNRIGMLVDLSHVADTTMGDALATTRAPVVFSHSSARALCGHARNVPDEVLARLPGNGGVCMVTFVPAFVSADRYGWERERDAEVRRTGQPRAVAAVRLGPPPPVTVAQVADHVEHVRADGCDDMPSGLTDVSGYPRLFAELSGRGWSADELAALAGGNVLRVLRAADDTAAVS